jgi:hypothetical protein
LYYLKIRGLFGENIRFLPDGQGKGPAHALQEGGKALLFGEILNWNGFCLVHSGHALNLAK